jgi:hypothetical protein
VKGAAVEEEAMLDMKLLAPVCICASDPPPTLRPGTVRRVVDAAAMCLVAQGCRPH